MRQIAAILLTLLALTGTSARAGDRAGDFDYYVLSLGWSATWCALTGDARGDPQCDVGRGLTFTLHGLWPQYDRGYPQDCFTGQIDASKAQTAAMADIMGGAGLAWHEWRKHGRCSGLPPADYFAAARRAYATVTIPPLFAGVDHGLTLPARVIEDAFLEANSQLSTADLTVVCSAGLINEVRICLSKDLSPRACSADVARDCRLPDAGLPPVR